jgi:histidinol-phosphate aminotransferase
MYRLDHLYRLNNNENFLGPVRNAVTKVHEVESSLLPQYPSGDGFSLTVKLAEKFNKSSEQFLVGNGSNELITSVVKAFCEKGDNIVAADKTYAVYEWVAQFSGFEANLVKLNDAHQLQPEQVLDAINHKTKVVFICNPNNPTGKYWDTQTLKSFLHKVDNRCIVVVDEAYIEFVDKDDFPNGMELMEEFPNVVVFRTFSKMYGLASFRIGYLCAQRELIQIIERTHTRYSVNHLAQLTAWETMHNDAVLIEATKKMVTQARSILVNCFDDLGLNHLGDQGNFWMAQLPVSDLMIYKKLMRKGYAVRPMTNFRFPNWIRVSMDRKEVMLSFCEALKTTLQG